MTAARLIVAALLLLAVRQPAIAQGGVFGRWATPGVSAIVELAPCGDASRLCGTIRWLWDGVDDKGRPRLDIRNADARLRSEDDAFRFEPAGESAASRRLSAEELVGRMRRPSRAKSRVPLPKEEGERR